jgi:translation initiation factor IF-1
MPGKSVGKAKRSTIPKNDNRNKALLEDPTALVGRTIKSLGNRWFQIQTTDAEGRGVEVRAHIPGKIIIIHVGDIVIVGRNESAGRVTYEIVGKCEKKTIKQLRDAKRLHPSLFSEADGMDDDLFDRDDEADVVKAKEEEEVDVDRI